jgi:hypothetical protein
VDRRHWVRNIHSAIQHVVPGALRDTGYLGDESRGDAQFHQAFAQQFDHCVEMRIVQAAHNQMLVAAPQVGSRVIVRAAEGHSQKCLLSADLTIHIDSLEKGGDSAIGQDLSVKEIDGGVNSSIAPQLPIQGRFPGLLFDDRLLIVRMCHFLSPDFIFLVAQNFLDLTVRAILRPTRRRR